MKAIEADTCVQAWLQACEYLLEQPGWRAYTLMLGIANPLALPVGDRAAYDVIDRFLQKNRGLPISTVVNTIFPAQLYMKHGPSEIYERYVNEIYPETRKRRDCGWGSYFYRLICRTDHEGRSINPLEALVEKLRSQLKQPGPNRAVYELGTVDPFLDIPIYDAGHDRNRPIGGPCLSHVSFKLDDEHRLMLTGFYRSHFYIQRAIGNLLGLAHLQNFVADQTGLQLGSLVCISSMAQLDVHAGRWAKDDIRDLIRSCHQAVRSDAA